MPRSWRWATTSSMTSGRRTWPCTGVALFLEHGTGSQSITPPGSGFRSLRPAARRHWPDVNDRVATHSGDTMFLIARSFRVPLSQLIAANPHIPNPAQIFPGDVLCVPGVAPVPVPCCAVLRPRVPVPAGTLGVALVQAGPSGLRRVTFAATLPPPAAFGRFNIYIATVLIPNIGSSGMCSSPPPRLRPHTPRPSTSRRLRRLRATPGW